jgi:hypothetical protein
MNRQRPHFETLVQQARGESPPRLDVAEQVVQTLASRVQLPATDGPWWWATALSLTAAAAVLVVAMQQGIWFEEAWVDWLCPFVLVMQ